MMYWWKQITDKISQFVGAKYKSIVCNEDINCKGDCKSQVVMMSTKDKDIVLQQLNDLHKHMKRNQTDLDSLTHSVYRCNQRIDGINQIHNQLNDMSTQLNLIHDELDSVNQTLNSSMATINKSYQLLKTESWRQSTPRHMLVKPGRFWLYALVILAINNGIWIGYTNKLKQSIDELKKIETQINCEESQLNWLQWFSKPILYLKDMF